MNPDLFDKQMERLKSNYGETAYRTERIAILWDTVKEMPDWWFVKAVEKWIGSLRMPPLQKEFAEEIIKEKERVWQETKNKERESSKAIGDTLLHAASIASNAHVMRCLTLLSKKLNFEISSEQFFKECDELDRITAGKFQCTCDNGLVFMTNKKGIRTLYACNNCKLGELAASRGFFWPGDKERQMMPFHISKEPDGKSIETWHDKY